MTTMRGPDSSSDDFVAVTPHDTSEIPQTRYLYVGGSGDLVCQNRAGTNITFTALPIGWHPIRTKLVRATGTTATDIVALY